MMGRTHALSGALAFGGATLVYSFDVPGLIVGATITTGAALFPDIDHTKATITKTFGPLTRMCHWVVHFVFGPHRMGTHSIFFAALAGYGAHFALIHRDHIVGQVVLSLLMILPLSAGIRLLRIRGWLDDVLPVVAIPPIVIFTDVDLSMVPIALAFGCMIHIIGDCLTDRGCPLFWPVAKTKFGINIFTTGKTGEKIVTLLIVLGIFAVVVAHVWKAFQ